MAVVLGGVRSDPGRRRRRCAGPDACRPSIREVCLLGVDSARPVRIPIPEGAWASGGRLTWSGRTYQVEATQVGETGAGEPFRYLHLSALAEV